MSAREELLAKFAKSGSKGSGNKGKSSTSDEDAEISDMTAIKAYLEQSQFNVTAGEIQEALNLAITSLPKTEAYLTGEIIIRKFNEIDENFFSLISAGTLPLDALLYLSLSSTKGDMFLIKGPISGEVNEISSMANMSRGAFIAWAVQVITRGSNPAGSAAPGQERPLAKLVKDRALNNVINYEHELIPLLSSGALSKFPSEALLSADLSAFPTHFYKRMMLSIAGTRGLRYCSLSMQFEKAKGTDTRTKRAVELAQLAAEKAGDVKVGMFLHPMNTVNGHRIPKFTDKLTNIALSSLTPNGREQMGLFILNKDMKAFMKDKNIFGVGSAEKFAVMKDSEADFMDITLDGMKSAFGI